ncbi:MAG: caspase family protein [Acidobacteria bacterium]|nr:caspase family protein [Acidobacteriota bacterium]
MKPAYLILLAVLFSALPRLHAQERCGLAKDLMVRALERIKPGSGPSDLEDALQLLKHSTSQCSSLGDAWYYRSLIESKLGDEKQARYALDKAKMFGAEALEQNADPFVLATATAAESGPPGPVHDKWALVIGVGKFHDGRLNLQYTTKDARDFAAALTDVNYGRFRQDHVRLLLDQDATTRNVKSELNQLARKAGRDDLVVIYLASHGSAREGDLGGVNYVVTYDTETDDPDGLYATALPMVELVNAVRNRVKSRRAVVILDTCHSGGALTAGARGFKVAAVNPSAASDDTLNGLRQGEGRAVLTSSRVDESSYESSKLHNGYFTFYLIQALKQGHGRDPIDKLYSNVRDAVAAGVQSEFHAHQTPVMSLSDKVTDIILGVDISGLQSSSVAP